jgi:serine/threonine-protein kinase HipA
LISISAGAYGYEQAFLVIRQLNLADGSSGGTVSADGFNIIARNQDDHVKNIAFLMDKAGRWSLAPAFDVIYSFNPDRRLDRPASDDDERQARRIHAGDFRACAKSALMKRGRAEAIVEEVRASVAKWPDYRGAGERD